MKKKATDSTPSQIERDLPVPEWHLELLEKRAKELEGLPPEERATDWEEVKKQIWPDKFGRS